MQNVRATLPPTKFKNRGNAEQNSYLDYPKILSLQTMIVKIFTNLQNRLRMKSDVFTQLVRMKMSATI